MEDRLSELRCKARRWLPLVSSDAESARQLRQMIDDDLDDLPAVCLMAVKMVTGALREEGCVGTREPGTCQPAEVSNSARPE